MNSLEEKMVYILEDLKENYHVSGIKAEFEAEGSRFDEVLKLKDLISKIGLDLTIKIGGCEAISDMREAKKLSPAVIVAPMVETPYAMKKFVNAIDNVFIEKENIKFYINTETITGFNNFNDMVTSDDFKKLDGVVLGRGDMTSSIGLTRDDVNSEQIYNIAYSISNIMNEQNKNFIVGGGVSVDSLPFFKRLPYLSGFQTRKVIFDSKTLLTNQADKGILKAIGFEIMWLKNKQEYYGLSKQDELRIEMLSKYNNLIETVNKN